MVWEANTHEKFNIPIRVLGFSICHCKDNIIKVTNHKPRVIYVMANALHFFLHYSSILTIWTGVNGCKIPWFPMQGFHVYVHELKFSINQLNTHFLLNPSYDNTTCISLVVSCKEAIKPRILANFFKLRGVTTSFNYNNHLWPMRAHILFAVSIKTCVGCTLTAPRKDIILYSHHKHQ